MNVRNNRSRPQLGARLACIGCLFLINLSCSHVRVIEITQHVDCRVQLKNETSPVSSANEIAAKENAHLSYNREIRATLEPYVRRGLAEGLRVLKKENALIRVSTPDKQLLAVVELTLDEGGGLLRRNSVCEFGIPEVDSALLASLQKLNRLVAPPKALLNENRQASVRWNVILAE